MLPKTVLVDMTIFEIVSKIFHWIIKLTTGNLNKVCDQLAELKKPYTRSTLMVMILDEALVDAELISGFTKKIDENKAAENDWLSIKMENGEIQYVLLVVKIL